MPSRDENQTLKEKILIISYYWPPYGGSGVQRWLKFTKYLPQFGFKPYVYTPSNPHFSLKDNSLLKDIHPEVVELKRPIWEPYKIAAFISGKKTNNSGLVGSQKNPSLIKKIMGSIRANFFIPDPRKYWVKPSVQFLTNIINYDCITHVVTTGPPHSLHLIGLKLKAKFPNLKWVVDIRDPWSKFDFLKNFGSSQRALQKQAKLEKSVLDNCDHVLATSESMKDLLVDFDHNKFTCITNGYDKEDFTSVALSPPKANSEIKIYHAGLLNQLRHPKVLWEALDRICASHSDIKENLKLHLVGIVDPNVKDDLNSFKHLTSCLFFEEYKMHEDVIRDYLDADILLLLVNNSDNAAANIPGKLFEYLALDKTILSVSAAETDVRRILDSLEGTMNISYQDSVIQIEEQLLGLIKKAKASVINRVETKKKYSRLNLTNDLVNLLKQL